MGWRILYYITISLCLFRGSSKKVSSQSHEPITLFPDGAPNEQPHWPPPHYCLQDPDIGEMCYNVHDPLIYPYLVPNATASIVVAPGGGYYDLAMDLEGFDVATRLNRLLINVFVLEYRVPERPDVDGMPKWWAPLQDAQRAISYIRGHADEWSIDPNRIGFLGFSAGGHLSAHIATAWQPRLYDSIDKYDLYSSQPNFSVLLYPWAVVDNNDPQSTDLANEIKINAETPDAFLIHAANDDVAPYQNSVQYYMHLLSANHSGRLSVYPKGGHGFGICQVIDNSEEICEWPEQVSHFVGDLYNITSRS